MRASILLAIALVCASAYGATFTVNSTADLVDATPGNGICATAAATCTLRAAIMEANATAGVDTINIPAGTFYLLIGGAPEDGALAGDLDITESVTINGASRDTAIIDALSADRVFDVIGGTPNVTFSQLTMRNGDATGDTGGAIKHPGPGTLTVSNVRFLDDWAGAGGSIFHANGALTLSQCFFTNGGSSAPGAALYHTGAGTVSISGSEFRSLTSTGMGAVFHAGPGNVSVDSSTFTDCQCGGGNGGALSVSGAGLTLSGSTFQTNFASVNGGAVYFAGSGDAMVTNCQFTSNSSAAGTGGAVDLSPAGSATLTGCTFTDNNTLAVGGGANIVAGGNCTLTNTRFSSNSCTSGIGGGAMIILPGAATLTGDVFENNTAMVGAAGLSINGYTSSDFSNCRFTGNQASTGLGGGLSINAPGPSPTTIATCTFDQNEVGSSGMGGAIYATGSVFTATGSTFSNNAANGPGGSAGAVSYFAGAAGSFSNCTFSGNVAGSVGGAVSILTAITFTNCTFADNAAINTGGGAISNTAPFVAVTLRNCILANSLAGGNLRIGGGATLTSSGGNISSDASYALAGTGDLISTDPRLGTLGNNGGTTQTIPLLAGSPGIGAGQGACLATDQRGNSRPATGCDSGAFEVSDCDGNGVDDTAELVNGTASDCNHNSIVDGCEALADADADGIPDVCDTCTDSDGDGFGNSGFAGNTCAEDGCPADPLKSAAGVCGCGTADTDTDADGIADCNDGCPSDPAKTAAGSCGCGVADTDNDADGVPNCHDNCPDTANADQADANGNGIGDVCEPGPSASCAPGLPLAGMLIFLGLAGLKLCAAVEKRSPGRAKK